jgi:hypothetical protein
MLVYGDHRRRECPAEKLGNLARALAEVEAMRPGLPRHAALVGLLVEAGELVQGLLDADFTEWRRDDATPLSEACARTLLAFGRAVVSSWTSGFEWLGPPVLPALQALRALPLPPEVVCKVPEGYVFYALYPEAYLEAALALVPEDPVRVIGLRSIGTSLAGVVAAAMGAEAPFTVRPGGHAFQRTLSLSEALEARLLADAPRHRFAIVDEGPGLSGSSFGAVADFLEDRGVPLERLCFLPGHLGPLGPQASERHRARWERAARHVVDFESLLPRPRERAHSLVAWVEDLTGPAEASLEDVGGGAWRRLLLREEDWPAVHVQQERRKFLLRAGGRRWLLKFAGLGAYGERRLARARVLQEAGFTPPVVGLRHGFLVQPWLEEARPLAALRDVDRRALVRRVGEYLGFRAKHFTVREAERGASPRQLLEMARRNVCLGLGAEWAEALGAWEPRLSSLERAVHRVETDNKLQPWEWLVLPEGRFLKADAVDHHEAHDLIGCQDIAWDLVGAEVELELAEDERALLHETVARRGGRQPDPEPLRFHRLCYLAFQLGHHALAADTLAGWLPEEANRLRRAAGRYEAELRRELTPGRAVGSSARYSTAT